MTSDQKIDWLDPSMHATFKPWRRLDYEHLFQSCDGWGVGNDGCRFATRFPESFLEWDEERRVRWLGEFFLLCDKYERMAKQVELHLIQYTEMMALSCRDCLRVFKDKRSLARHLHYERLRFQTPAVLCCGVEVETLQRMDHVNKFHLVKPVRPCPACDLSFPTFDHLLHHHLSVHEEELADACHECGFVGKTSRITDDHVRAIHAKMTFCKRCKIWVGEGVVCAHPHPPITVKDYKPRFCSQIDQLVKATALSREVRNIRDRAVPIVRALGGDGAILELSSDRCKTIRESTSKMFGYHDKALEVGNKACSRVDPAQLVYEHCARRGLTPPPASKVHLLACSSVLGTMRRGPPSKDGLNNADIARIISK